MTTVLYDLSTKFGVSDPQVNPLHCKWLGAHARASRRRRKFYTDVFSLSFSVGSVTAHTHLIEGESKPHTLLHVGTLKVDAILTNWAFMTAAHSSNVFSAESDAPFVACELQLDTIELTERMDVIKKLLDKEPSRDVKVTPSTPRVIGPVPIIIVDIAVTNIRARLLHGTSHNGDAPSSLDICTGGFEVHGRTHIREVCTVLGHTDIEMGSSGFSLSISDKYPLRLDFTAHAFIEPICVRYCLDPTSTLLPRADEAGNPQLESAPSTPPNPQELPIITLSGIELSASGHAFGFVSEDKPAASLILSSSMGEIRCLIDGITIELWNPRVLAALAKSIISLRPSSPRPSSPHRPLISGLPAGICAHLSIGCITAILAGKDINPDCDQGLLRGIALRTGVMAQYCYLQSPKHTSRTKQRFAHARLRERLGVPHDILLESASFANDGDASGEFVAIAQAGTFNTSCQAVAIGQADVDNSTLPELNLSFKKDDRTFISAPTSTTRFTIRCKREDLLVESSEEVAQVNLDIPRIYAHLELHHIYCALLAVGALRCLAPPPALPVSTSPPASSTSPLRLGLTLRIHNVQLNCALPGAQRIFIRGRLLNIDRPAQPAQAQRVIVRWANIFAWVPSVEHPGRWEELIHFQKGSVTLKDSVVLVGDGAHLRIPYDFVLADLISSIVIMGKAARHLVRIAGSGRFIAVPDVEAEDAKVFPPIKIQLGVLTAEAADSPLESKLNLIYRAGSTEQQIRLDRELAFDAKVAAIKEAATGYQDKNSPHSAFEWNFSSKHTISTDDAWLRLQEVNSLAWIKRHRHIKEKVTRREEALSRRVRDEGSHDEPPLPIDACPPDKAVPLFRAVLNGVALNISQPTFGSTGLRPFLKDLGDLPENTEFTLLVPLHISWLTDSARINLRDYPLPLLNIPPHPNKRQSAWEFKSDIVIAEEMGPPTAVFWEECTIIPSSDSSPAAKAFSFSLPRTIMPVKSYANPQVSVHSPGITDLSWGVSYSPAVQDLMRVFETLSHPPRDSSPSVGFWDKMRLSLHWRARVNFAGEVYFHLKGKLERYYLGFVLTCISQAPAIHIRFLVLAPVLSWHGEVPRPLLPAMETQIKS